MLQLTDGASSGGVGGVVEKSGLAMHSVRPGTSSLLPGRPGFSAQDEAGAASISRGQFVSARPSRDALLIAIRIAVAASSDPRPLTLRSKPAFSGGPDTAPSVPRIALGLLCAGAVIVRKICSFHGLSLEPRGFPRSQLLH
jgi:hypothetical protein